MSRKRDVARINGPLLCLLHKCAAEEAARCGSFRINRIRVGSAGNPLSFVAAQVDVARIIKEVSPAYDSLEIMQKAYFVAFIMSILHPFEDGNGRTMRMWLISLAASSETEEVAAFLSFLALYVKFRQRDLVTAMDQLSDGLISGVENFHAEAVEFFECLFNKEEPGTRIFDWAISVQPEGSLMARIW
ncbi:Fic family protein [Stenotrophomonas maltophilia]|uniref:Fic family protein n=1 Tax=Stenotrophomonas maltophilia TaxID=40324 RepID=UPI001EE4130F|nr:Fic family protein [Stenotrophomonas maltophilia]